MNKSSASIIGNFLHRSRNVFISAGVFSLFVNLAMLNSPLFMLQVYDRVMTSQSKDTLLFLTLLSVGVLLFQSLVEVVRSDLLVRASSQLDNELRDHTFGISMEKEPTETSSAHGLRDLESIRSFLASPALIALFDAPWTPIFLFIVFLLHPALGCLALAGALVIIGLAYLSEVATGKPVNLFEGHTHYVMGVAFRADGRVLATAGADGTVVTWDMILGERKKKIEGWRKEVTSVQFLGATNQIVTSAGDNLVRIVTDEGAQVRAIANLPEFMQSAACCPATNAIVAGGEDSVLRVWNSADGKELVTFGVN